MPRRAVQASSSSPRAASNPVRSSARTRNAASRAQPVSEARVSTRSSASARGPEVHPAPTRQLRSRVVPVIPADAAAAVPYAIRGRRRSQSASSSRVSETATCDQVNASVVGRTPGRPPSRTRTLAVTTRRTTRTSARMSLGSTYRIPNLRARAVQEQQATSATAVANTQRVASRAVAQRSQKSVQANTAQRKQDKKAADSQQTLVSCKFAGCQEKLLPVDVASHSSTCSSRLPCPLDCQACLWQGATSHAVDHLLKDHHTVTCVTGPNVNVPLRNWRRAPPLQWAVLQTCLGYNFLIVLQKVLKNRCPLFLGTVRVFGQQEAADRFEFRMALKTEGRVGRTFAYSSVVRAMYDGAAAISEGDCFNFDSSYAEIFSCDDNLDVNVSIAVMKM